MKLILKKTDNNHKSSNANYTVSGINLEYTYEKINFYYSKY